MADPRPVVVVSKCLLGRRCRYDGKVISCPAVLRLGSRVRFVPVCPETAIGLGVPRAPIRIVRRPGRVNLVQPKTGRRLTRKMGVLCRGFLAALPAVDGFILKSRSPSCGVRDAPVYGSTTASRATTRGAGLFAAAVRQRLPRVPMADETQSHRRFLSRVLDLYRRRTMMSAEEE
jgi:uncharacterized protein YbbK (DUF523 family)